MTVCAPSIPPVQVPAPAGIALWLVDLSPASPLVWQTILSSEEQQRAHRFKFEADRRRYINSHIALHTILAEQTGISGACLPLSAQSHGKPRLTDVPIEFNLSHSGEWALLGVSQTGPIGVDIEMIAPIPETAELAARNFTASEQAQWEKTPECEQLSAFLRGWTRKEACLKALGSGLSIEPHVFEAGIESAARDTWIDVAGQRCPMTVWSIDLPIAAQAAVALIDPAFRHLTL